MPDAPSRVVIDPNVWIAAVINPHGKPGRLADAVRAGEVVAVASGHLLDELTTVLIRPKFRRWVTVADAVAFVETLGGLAEVHPDPANPPGRVRDPDDDYLVALAEAVGAVIVTGDADLLDADLKPPAITPAQLLGQLAD